MYVKLQRPKIARWKIYTVYGNGNMFLFGQQIYILEIQFKNYCYSVALQKKISTTLQQQLCLSHTNYVNWNKLSLSLELFINVKFDFESNNKTSNCIFYCIYHL